MALYLADDGVTPVTTHSMLKTFRMCPREAYYKYHERLQPKQVGKALHRGKWFHALMEKYHMGEDWIPEHRRWSAEFSKLFDEEKDRLGDLPRELAALMKAYIWHYSDPQYADYDWKVHEVERTLEAELPNGHILRGRVDMIVEDQFGLYLVDHKTHAKVPNWDFRGLDEQSPLYIWLCHQNDIPVNGFIWNYVVTKGISTPRIVKAGDRFYANMGDLDYPTLARAVKQGQATYPNFLENKEERSRVARTLKNLKSQRWAPDKPQTSPFFRRDLLEKDNDLIDRVLATAVRTSDTMHAYDFSEPDKVERSTFACNGFFCHYRSLAVADLLNGDSTMVRRREYIEDDPLAYYGETEEDMNGDS